MLFPLMAFLVTMDYLLTFVIILFLSSRCVNFNRASASDRPVLPVRLETRLDHLRDSVRIDHRLRIGQLQRAEVLGPAVHGDDLAGDESRCGAEEEDGHVRDVLDVAIPAGREVRRVRVFAAWALGAQAVHAFRACDGSRGDDIGPDALRSRHVS